MESLFYLSPEGESDPRPTSYQEVVLPLNHLGDYERGVILYDWDSRLKAIVTLIL